MRNGFIYFIGLLSIALIVNAIFMATFIAIGNSYAAVASIAQTTIPG